MPREVFRTGRAELRRLAAEVGFDPDNLTQTQLRDLERLERMESSGPVRLKESSLRKIAEERGMDPNKVTRTELAELVRAKHTKHADAVFQSTSH